MNPPTGDSAQPFPSSHSANRTHVLYYRGGEELEPQPPGRPRRARPLVPLAAALLVAALLAVIVGDTALAQGPPDEPMLVNAGEKFIERKDDGSFIARPVWSTDRIADLYYGIRHPDTGEWIGAVYKLHGGEQRLREGWEYTFEYPVIDRQPELDPDRWASAAPFRHQQ